MGIAADGDSGIPAEQIREAFGLDAPVRSADVQGGTSGRTIRLTAGTQPYFLRRRAAEHSDTANIRYEHQLLEMLATAELPVAPPVRTRSGATFLELGSQIYELYPWIDGTPFQPADRGQITALGRTIAEFHQATRGWTSRKRGQEREDDPARLLRDLDAFLPPQGRGEAGHRLVSALTQRLRRLELVIRRAVYGKLPQAVIHGDLHPGNVLFKRQSVAGIFDFDWVNRQERVRDVSDGLLFFAGAGPGADSGAAPADDIWSLTRGISPDPGMNAALLDAYEEVSALEPAEREALPPVMGARWLQIRIRGMRKVEESRRMEFLDRGNLLATFDKLTGSGLRV